QWPSRLSTECRSDRACVIYPAGFEQVTASLDLRQGYMGVSIDPRLLVVHFQYPDHGVCRGYSRPIHWNDYRSGWVQLRSKLELQTGLDVCSRAKFCHACATTLRDTAYCYRERQQRSG